jgi:hypothetical protein
MDPCPPLVYNDFSKEQPKMRKQIFSFILLVGAALLSAACSYNSTSIQGIQVTPAQIQEIKLGRTTGLDLIMLLGPPARMERIVDDKSRLVYAWTDIKSLTFPGGYRAVGLWDKEERQGFEVILKEGQVQSYRFIKP